MASGLVGLLDDIAALAKLAAASVDDIGLAAGKASMKAAGVVVDDTAVTPTYVHGLTANRELPIIRRIATGSLRNKLLFILPVAILLSEVAPKVVEVILMLGGAFLCYEGAHKLVHALRHRSPHPAEPAGGGPAVVPVEDLPAVAIGEDAEAEVIKGAIRTDFILSAEIMVIALKEVVEEPLLSRCLIMVVVALVITVIVYGLVAGIVKMDDAGLLLASRRSGTARRFGRGLVTGMPILLTWLSRVGTAAMLWVGGHILLVGADELGWHGPYGLVHDLESTVHDLPLGGLLAWLVNTAISAAVGLAVGLVVAFVVSKVQGLRKPAVGAAAH